MLFVDSLHDKESFFLVERKEDVIDWDFRQIYNALPLQRYGDFWPRQEMARTLLCENLKIPACQSPVFLHLVTNFI